MSGRSWLGLGLGKGLRLRRVAMGGGKTTSQGRRVGVGMKQDLLSVQHEVHRIVYCRHTCPKSGYTKHKHRSYGHTAGACRNLRSYFFILSATVPYMLCCFLGRAIFFRVFEQKG